MTSTHDHSGAPTHPADAGVDDQLRRIEARRQQQLDEMTASELDPVAISHRESVRRILQEVRAARRRFAAGLYGACTRCETAIPAQRLQLRPWVATCVPCAARDRL
ncbi:hypothetical protein GCM10028777_40030 [Angustibacter speluncae]